MNSTPQTIVTELQRAGTLSRAELSERLALPSPTVARSVSRLLDEGVLEESGTRASVAGRPSQLLRVRPRVAVAVAVDIGASETTTAIVDLDGEVTGIRAIPSDPARALEERFPDVVDAIATALEWAEREEAPCVAIGASVPSSAIPSAADPCCEEPAGGIAALTGMIRSRFALPVTIERDASLLAFAEARWGEGRESSVLVALALSWGIGAGIVIDGDIFRGSGAGAGLIDRMLVGTRSGADGRAWPCALEDAIGVMSLARRLDGADSHPASDVAVVQRLVDAAKGNGDPQTAVVIEQVLDDLAAAIVNIAVVVDPDVVVFSGVLGEHVDELASPLLARLSRLLPRVPRLVPSALGPTAWLSAAGLLAIESTGPLLTLLRQADARRSTPGRRRGSTTPSG